MPDRVIAQAASDLHEAIDDLHDLVEIVETLQAKSRRQRWMTALLGAVVVALVILAWFTWQESDRRERETDDARYSGCVNYNVEQQGDRNSALNGALVTYGFAESGDLTGIERTAIVAGLPADLQDRYEAFEEQVARDNPFRDCSPDGIREFIAEAPADPALPTTSGD